MSPASAAKQDAELKAARRLGVTPDTIVKTARKLWGRTLTEERDRLVGENVAMHEYAGEYWAGHGQASSDPRPRRTLQAVRGHISRALVVELATAIRGKR